MVYFQNRSICYIVICKNYNIRGWIFKREVGIVWVTQHRAWTHTCVYLSKSCELIFVVNKLMERGIIWVARHRDWTHSLILYITQ
jgi:hypothetical protein